MKPSETTTRTMLGILASAALLLLPTGCSGPEPVPGAQPAKGGEVQFTSDSGLITINVPTTWREDTAAARDLFSSMGFPASEVQAGWSLDAESFATGSSVSILTYRGALYDSLLDDSVEFADLTFTSLIDVLGSSSARNRSTYTTDAGVVFERMDFSHTVTGEAVYQVELITVVDRIGIEITLTLMGSDTSRVDAFLEAVSTFVVQ